MVMIKLISPSLSYEAQIKEFRAEFLANNDNMDGTSFLSQYEDVHQWLRSVEANSHHETVAEGLVVASQWLAVRESDDRLVGMLSVRHTLNEYLSQFGGHIGYSVRSSERNQGYAKEMLKLSLAVAQSIGLEKVLVTCDKDNQASAKVIQANGGVFESELLEEGQPVQRYWITLPQTDSSGV